MFVISGAAAKCDKCSSASIQQASLFNFISLRPFLRLVGLGKKMEEEGRRISFFSDEFANSFCESIKK